MTFLANNDRATQLKPGCNNPKTGSFLLYKVQGAERLPLDDLKIVKDKPSQQAREFNWKEGSCSRLMS